MHQRNYILFVLAASEAVQTGRHIEAKGTGKFVTAWAMLHVQT